MVENHDHGSEDKWEALDRKGDYHHLNSAKGNSMGLVVILALIMGMGLYIGSFYWNREPLPKVSKKHKPSQSDIRTFPVSGFEKNYG